MKIEENLNTIIVLVEQVKEESMKKEKKRKCKYGLQMKKVKLKKGK